MTDHRNGSLGAVGRFFFSPTDPSTLGFMRVMAGLLVLYTTRPTRSTCRRSSGRTPG